MVSYNDRYLAVLAKRKEKEAAKAARAKKAAEKKAAEKKAAKAEVKEENSKST